MEKKRKLSCFTIATASIFIASGRYFFEMLVHYKNDGKQTRKRRIKLSQMKINHPRYQFEEEYEAGKAWCRQQDMKDWYIRSEDGLKLHAYYLPAESDAKRFVLLSHGYKGSGFGDFANIARFLHEHNCNLLFIDQRCCGMSEGEFITFGAREQDDIGRWAYRIAAENKEKLPIYLYGESMGAASVLMASGKKLPDEVKGLIADCGFQSMKGQIRDLAGKWFHLPRVEFLLFRLSVSCRLSGKFRMEESDTTKALSVINKRPVLFFHGSDDTYVYPKNSIDNYDLCHAPKELVIIQGARHLCSAYVNPKLYRKKLMDFFEKYD
jgi:hypothetical protein